jgi:hypothetical protein
MPPKDKSNGSRYEAMHLKSTAIFCLMCILPAAMQSGTVARENRFTPDRPNLVQLNLEGKPNGVFVKGRLSRNRMTYSYRFFGQKNQILVWDFKGPAIRAIIAYPDGNTDGPGLPPEIPLNQDGAYVFSVASNTMADKIFGIFTIHLTLRAQN